MSVIVHEPVLFTPKEAVQISRYQGALGTIDIVQEVEKAWGHQYDDPQWNYYCMLSAIFEAGYIQGKREERKRRQSKRQDNTEIERLYAEAAKELKARQISKQTLHDALTYIGSVLPTISDHNRSVQLAILSIACYNAGAKGNTLNP